MNDDVVRIMFIKTLYLTDRIFGFCSAMVIRMGVLSTLHIIYLGLGSAYITMAVVGFLYVFAVQTSVVSKYLYCSIL